MARHETTVTVALPPTRLIHDLADPASMAALDPGVRSAVATSEGTLRAGFTSDAVHAFYGRDIRVSHEIVVISDHELVRRGTGNRITMVERYDARPIPSGTEIMLSVEVTLSGLLRPLERGLVAVLEHRLDQLARAITRLPAAH